MTRRTVYGITSGDYSSYSVHVLFDAKPDADLVCARLNGRGNGYRGEYEVEEFPAFDAGDTTYRQEALWRAYVSVNDQGRILSEPYSHLVDDADAEPGQTRVDRANQHAMQVQAFGRTQEQAVKGVKDRAAALAGALLDGVDPRDLMYGPPTPEDIASARDLADLEEARLERERQLAFLARRRTKVRSHLVNRRVAVFRGDVRVCPWDSFGRGYSRLPGHLETTDGLEVRFGDGTPVPGSVVGELLGAGHRERAMVWPRVVSDAEVDAVIAEEDAT